jgi:hypothetical protein
MQCRLRLYTLFLFVILCASTALASGDAAAVPPDSKLLATIPLAGTTIKKDARARRVIDAIVPELAKTGHDALIRLEGHSRGGKTRNQYIEKSLLLAKNVENYLRLDKGLNSDLYLAAINDDIPITGGNYIRIVIYPNIYKEKFGISQVVGQ